MRNSQQHEVKSVRHRFAKYACWQFTHLRNNCTNICRVASTNCHHRALPL